MDVESKIDLDALIRRLEPKPEEISIGVEQLQHFYGEGDTRSHILKDLNLNITAGEIVTITGPSGCGKTTLLTLVGTLRRICEGSITALGTELNGLPGQQIGEMRKKMGFIFQAHNLFESLTAFQNVNMAAELLGIDKATAKKRIEEILTRLGLGHRIHYKPDSLSGGQKQRVAIARGIVHTPPLILADEPTAALDGESTETVIQMFREMADEYKTTILIVTHDQRIKKVADRIVNFGLGKIESNTLPDLVEFIGGKLMSVDEKSESEIKLFSRLTPTVLTDVVDSMKLRQYKRGDDVIRQGETGREFFVIARGEVEILIDGNRVNTLGSGSYFGEVALMKEQARNATVRALNDLVCFILEKEDFKAVVDSSPSFEEELRKAIFDRQ